MPVIDQVTGNTYDIGDRIRVKCDFKDQNDVVADPGDVTLKVKPPDGIVATYTYLGATVNKSAVGQYYKDVSLNQEGKWYYKFEGTAPIETAGERWFLVRDSAFTGGL
jgi:hypothetical protein